MEVVVLVASGLAVIGFVLMVVGVIVALKRNYEDEWRYWHMSHDEYWADRERRQAK